jgi:hypothetical protein
LKIAVVELVDGGDLALQVDPFIGIGAAVSSRTRAVGGSDPGEIVGSSERERAAMAKRAATISPSSGDVEVYIAQANASIAAELAPAAAAVSPFTIEVRFPWPGPAEERVQERGRPLSRVIVGDLPSVKVDNEVIDAVILRRAHRHGVGGSRARRDTHLRPQSAGVAAFLPAKGKMTSIGRT